MTTSSRISEPRIGELAVPGARLYYEVRGAGPLLVLVGAPMAAADFAAVAEQLAATHTVLTTDPRGHRGSTLDHPAADSTPALRGDDLARLIEHLGAGPATVFGSSGGAVSALALVQRRPDLVATVIAHEPPLIELLDDREALRADTHAMIATYLSRDVVGAWRKFFAQANIPIPDEALEQMFGGARDPEQAATERYWFEHELLGTVTWQPDIAALTAQGAKVVVGVGADSAGQLCDRTSRALAARLGGEPMVFPGDHTGFVDDPAGFAAFLTDSSARR